MNVFSDENQANLNLLSCKSKKKKRVKICTAKSHQQYLPLPPTSKRGNPELQNYIPSSSIPDLNKNTNSSKFIQDKENINIYEGQTVSSKNPLKENVQKQGNKSGQQHQSNKLPNQNVLPLKAPIKESNPLFAIYEDIPNAPKYKEVYKSLNKKGISRGHYKHTNFEYKAALCASYTNCIGGESISEFKSQIPLNQFAKKLNLPKETLRRHLIKSGLRGLIDERLRLLKNSGKFENARLGSCPKHIEDKVNMYLDGLEGVKKKRSEPASYSNQFLEEHEALLLTSIINNMYVGAEGTSKDFVQSLINQFLQGKYHQCPDLKNVNARYAEEFCKKYNIHKYKSMGVDKSRVEMATEEVRDTFFSMIPSWIKLMNLDGRCKYKSILDIPAKNIYNMDETALKTTEKRPVNYGNKCDKANSQAIQKLNEGDQMNFHISQALTSRADGYYRTETSDGAPGPLIIVQSNSTKSKHTDNTEEISRWEECPNNVPIQFIEAILEKDSNEFDKYTNKCNLSVLTSPNGSMQQNIIEYYADHFIDNLPKDREKDDIVILFMDKHSSRNSLPFLRKMYEANVLIVILPSHTSIFIQPLDLGVNSSKKGFESKSIGLWRFLNQTRSPTKVDCIKVLKAAWINFVKKEHSMTFNGETNAAASGFRKSGLYPFDPWGLTVLNTAIESLQNVNCVDTAPPYVVTFYTSEQVRSNNSREKIENARIKLLSLKSASYTHDTVYTIALKLCNGMLRDWDSNNREKKSFACYANDENKKAALIFCYTISSMEVIKDIYKEKYDISQEEISKKTIMASVIKRLITLSTPGKTTLKLYKLEDDSEVGAYQDYSQNWFVSEKEGKTNYTPIPNESFLKSGPELYYEKRGENLSHERNNTSDIKRQERKEAKYTSASQMAAGMYQVRNALYPLRLKELAFKLNTHKTQLKQEDFMEGGKFCEYLNPWQVESSFGTTHYVAPNGKSQSGYSDLHFQMVKKNMVCLKCKNLIEEKATLTLQQQLSARLTVNPQAVGGNALTMMDCALAKLEKKKEEKSNQENVATEKRIKRIEAFIMRLKPVVNKMTGRNFSDIASYAAKSHIKDMIFLFGEKKGLSTMEDEDLKLELGNVIKNSNLDEELVRKKIEEFENEVRQYRKDLDKYDSNRDISSDDELFEEHDLDISSDDESFEENDPCIDEELCANEELRSDKNCSGNDIDNVMEDSRTENDVCNGSNTVTRIANVDHREPLGRVPNITDTDTNTIFEKKNGATGIENEEGGHIPSSSVNDSIDNTINGRTYSYHFDKNKAPLHLLSDARVANQINNLHMTTIDDVIVLDLKLQKIGSLKYNILREKTLCEFCRQLNITIGNTTTRKKQKFAELLTELKLKLQNIDPTTEDIESMFNKIDASIKGRRR